MLGIVREINGEKTIIPLTTDTGTGAPVGTLIQQYKKKPMSGYLYCDGSTFDENDYPALYMYLGSNVLPDYSNSVENGYVYIKATSGLAENQQENVLNDVKNYVDNSNSYSTQEVKTGGKWIDGKPIYRKIVEVASLPNNTQTSYNHGIVNVDSFTTIRGIAKSTTLSLPIPFIEITGNTNIQIYAQTVNFVISTNYDASSYTGTIILEYTKTTD